MCAVILEQLLDKEMLASLETCGAINWNSVVLWQYRKAGSNDGWVDMDSALCTQLEAGYKQGPLQVTFLLSFTAFQADYRESKLLNTSTSTMFEIRRLAFAPLMPMKVSRLSHTHTHTHVYT